MPIATESKSSEIESTMKNLPPEVIQKILLYLDPDDIDNVWNCCKSWRNIVDYEYIWKKLCQRNNFEKDEESLRLPCYSRYMESFPHYWQGLFHYNYNCNKKILQQHWRNNVYKEHMYEVNSKAKVIYFDDEICITDFFKFRMNIYSNVTGQLIDSKIIIRSTNFFQREVKRYQDFIIFWFDHVNVNTLNLEASLKVWNMKTKEWVCIINESDLSPYYHHIIPNFDKKNFEFDILYTKKYNLTGDCEVYKSLFGIIRKSCLYVINYETKEVIFSHKSHYDVTSFCFAEGKIVFGNSKGVVQFLDLDCKPWMELDYKENVKIVAIKIIIRRLYSVTLSEEMCVGACVWSIDQQIKLYEIREVCYCRPDLLSTNINKNNFIFLYTTVSEKPKKYFSVWNFLQGNCVKKIDAYDSDKIMSNSLYVFDCKKNCGFTYSCFYKLCTETVNMVKLFNVSDLRRGLHTVFVTETILAHYVNTSERRYICIKNFT